LAILEKWLEIDQLLAVILHSA